MMNESKRVKFDLEQRKKFNRHISYMKEGDYNKDKYKSKREWVEHLDKIKRNFRKNQRTIK